MSKSGNYYYEYCLQNPTEHSKMVLGICDNVWSLVLGRQNNQSLVNFFANYGPFLDTNEFRLETIHNLGKDAVRLSIIRCNPKPDKITIEYLETNPMLKYSIYPSQQAYAFKPNSAEYDYLRFARNIEDIYRNIETEASQSAKYNNE